MMRNKLWSWAGLIVLTAALGGCEHLNEISGKIKGINHGVDQVNTGVSNINHELSPGSTSSGKDSNEDEGTSEDEVLPEDEEQPGTESTEEDESHWLGLRAPTPKGDSHQWYVSPPGSDQAAGSRQAPFRTINRAIAAATPGDVIRVQAGEYPEHLVIDGKARPGTRSAPIVLEGEGRPKIVPSKSSGALVQVRRPYWLVKGFEVDVRMQPRFAVIFEGNTEGSALARCHLHHGTSGAGVSVHGHARRVLIQGNSIHHFRKPGDDSHGVVVQATSSDVVIRNNKIHHNSGDSVQCLKPENRDQSPARRVLIERNDLYANGENAVDIKTCHDVVIRGNRMHALRKSATSSGEAVVVHYSARDVKIQGNTIYDVGRGIAVGGVTEGGPVPTQVTVSDNHIRGTTSAGGGDGSGIRVENARKVRVLHNTIEDTDGYGLMLGLGANGAPSDGLTVEKNVIRTTRLVRLGKHRPGLHMDENAYSPGGMFKVDPLETRDFEQWKRESKVDQNSVQRS
jgi:nitrous oxidase accessory protein NosD